MAATVLPLRRGRGYIAPPLTPPTVLPPWRGAMHVKPFRAVKQQCLLVHGMVTQPDRSEYGMGMDMGLSTAVLPTLPLLVVSTLILRISRSLPRADHHVPAPPCPATRTRSNATH